MDDDRDLEEIMAELKDWVVRYATILSKVRINKEIPHEISRKALLELKRSHPEITNPKIAEAAGVSVNVVKEWLRDEGYRLTPRLTQWASILTHLRGHLRYQGGTYTFINSLLDVEGEPGLFEKLAILDSAEFMIKTKIKETIKEL